MGWFRNLLIYLVFLVSLVDIFVFFQFVTYKLNNEKEKQFAVTNVDHRVLLKSTCSHAAYQRGPHQKIIAYSIYGDFSRAEVSGKYLKPFRETIKMIPIIYPGK
jgi:hypothetical protein